MLVGDALRIMKFSGRFGGGSEEGSGLVDEDDDDPEIFMEIHRKDGAPVGVSEAVGARGDGVMDDFWSRGCGNVDMVHRKGHYSDEFWVGLCIVFVFVVFCY